MTEPVYYEPPPEHERHLTRVWIWLGIFFAAVTVACLLFILNAPAIARHLPFSAEQRFVRPYESIISYLADDEHAPGELLVERYLGELVRDLAGRMELPPEFDLSVHYVDTKQINAFATLGGHIIVFRGLIEAMPDENSLAMVLAHEIAHVKNRDPIVSLGRGMALQVLYSFVTGNYRPAADAAAYGGEFGLLRFSREQERAADRLGAAAIEAKYGHVAGLDTIFRVMLEQQEQRAGELPEWLSTHPALEARIAELNEYADSSSWSRGPTTPIPRAVRPAADPEQR